VQASAVPTKRIADVGAFVQHEYFEEQKASPAYQQKGRRSLITLHVAEGLRSQFTAVRRSVGNSE